MYDRDYFKGVSELFLDRLFDVAFVRPPGNSYVNCVSSHPERKEIDVTLARQQHREYVSILKEAGIEVIQLHPLEAHPDSVFMQDPALLGASRSVVGRFGEEARRGEEKVLIAELAGQRIKVGALRFMVAPGTLEGGDVVVTDRGIFVGESRRTNVDGIKQFRNILADQPVTGVRTELMHLLCACSFLNNGTMIMAPDLVSPDLFPGFKLVRIPEHEAYACDALYIAGGKVLIPAGFPTAAAKLKDSGYEPVELDVSEFRKGDGGVTCLSSPIYKLF
jgi:dimethylargininase